MADLGNVGRSVQAMVPDGALSRTDAPWPDTGAAGQVTGTEGAMGFAPVGSATSASAALFAQEALTCAPPGVWPYASMQPPAPPADGAAGKFTSAAGAVADIPVSGVVTLLRSGQHVMTAKGTGGHTYFYDLEDGTYTAVISGGATTWLVEVASTTATVTLVTGGAAGPAGLLVGDRLLVLADDGRIKTRPKVV